LRGLTLLARALASSECADSGIGSARIASAVLRADGLEAGFA
jgi:hypothetical protein